MAGLFSTCALVNAASRHRPAQSMSELAAWNLPTAQPAADVDH
jgi:hypothetical protein